jgi:anti-sigma B factor antagonist
MSMDEHAEEFTMAVRRDGRHAVVVISGELDLHESERLSERLSTLLTDAATVELDAQGITFIDSAGLRALLIAWQTARERGAEFRVTAVSKQMAWMLEVAGVPDLLPSES